MEAGKPTIVALVLTQQLMRATSCNITWHEVSRGKTEQAH
jgi:hypothetical protein